MTTQTIIVKESMMQSMVSDFFTFGALLLCIWVSWKTDSLFWQFILGSLWLAYLIAKVVMFDASNYKKFRSYEEAHAWLGKQIGESQ